MAPRTQSNADKNGGGAPKTNGPQRLASNPPWMTSHGPRAVLGIPPPTVGVPYPLSYVRLHQSFENDRAGDDGHRPTRSAGRGGASLCVVHGAAAASPGHTPAPHRDPARVGPAACGSERGGEGLPYGEGAEGMGMVAVVGRGVRSGATPSRRRGSSVGRRGSRVGTLNEALVVAVPPRRCLPCPRVDLPMSLAQRRYPPCATPGWAT